MRRTSGLGADRIQSNSNPRRSREHVRVGARRSSSLRNEISKSSMAPRLAGRAEIGPAPAGQWGARETIGRERKFSPPKARRRRLNSARQPSWAPSRPLEMRRGAPLAGQRGRKIFDFACRNSFAALQTDSQKSAARFLHSRTPTGAGNKKGLPVALLFGPIKRQPIDRIGSRNDAARASA